MVLEFKCVLNIITSFASFDISAQDNLTLHLTNFSELADNLSQVINHKSLSQEWVKA